MMPYIMSVVLLPPLPRTSRLTALGSGEVHDDARARAGATAEATANGSSLMVCEVEAEQNVTLI